MSVSRRKFLQHSVLTAAACATLPLEGLAQSRRSSEDIGTERDKSSPKNGTERGQGDTLEHLNRDSFASAVGSGFQVSGDESGADSVWLRLLSVNDFVKPTPVNPANLAVQLKKPSFQPATTAFSLVFLGPAFQLLSQNTYVFRHDDLGTFRLFIVPNGLGQQTYTAVINRLDVAVPDLTGAGQQRQVPITVSSPAHVAGSDDAPASGLRTTSSGNEALSLDRAEIQDARRGEPRD